MAIKQLFDRIKVIWEGEEIDAEDWGEYIPFDGRVRPNAFPKNINFSSSYSVKTYPDVPLYPAPESEFPKNHVGYWINYMAEHNSIPGDDPAFCEWLAQDYVAPGAKPAIVDGYGYAVLHRMEPNGVYAAVEITGDKTAIVHGWFTQKMLDESERAGFAGTFYGFPVDELERRDDY